LPHITWCTTGPLSFLPIHAAGCYNKSQPRFRIFDYVISSYTPTLSALLGPAKRPDQFSGILAVGQEMTPGMSHLPCALEELNRIEQAAGSIRLRQLSGADATVEAVLSGIEEYSWVHLACHATQDPDDPNQSAFFLHNGKLNLAKITRKPLKNAGLAFLSACQTAAGHKELPEEAIHLAAGMIMAGFPTVIATMWSIKDKHAPLIAEHVYAELLRGGVADSRRSAQALHQAVAHLREEAGEDKYEEWAPFVHVGL
jgi:CHAT domain-containing protein